MASLVPLMAAGAVFVVRAAGHPAHVVCPSSRLVAVAGTPADLTGLAAVVRATVPRVFGGMTNQAGGGA
jgi:hypothetical protein